MINYLLLLCALVVYPFIVLSVSSKIADRQTGARRKLIMYLLSIAVMGLLPILDEVLGRIYLSYYCHFKSDLVVYRQAELPEADMKADGTPKIITNQSVWEEETLNHQYRLSRTTDRLRHFNIERKLTRIVEVRDSTVLAEDVYYIHWGGWLINHLGGHVSGVSCQIRPDHFDQFLASVFVTKRVGK